jgi:tRNA-uridine 2-sulfurtransferase
MKCIVMFSGGLDSTIAVHLLMNLGFDVLALNYMLPFYSGFGLSHNAIKARAASLGVPLMVEEEGQEYLDMFKSRKFGFGKNVNPCIDCRIHRFKKAAVIMARVGASFIATGEVVGQRPMSQRRECFDIIEKQSGLKGQIVRPLCAKILKATIAEERGWIRREDMLDIWGRGRKVQMAYAARFGLSYPMPAGGCLLTHIRTAERYADLEKNDPGFSLNDFKLLAYGRHFRINQKLLFVQARDDSENDPVDSLRLPQDTQLLLHDIPGPVGLVRGEATEEEMKLVCSIFAKYTRERIKDISVIVLTKDNKQRVIEVKPASEEVCEKYRI